MVVACSVGKPIPDQPLRRSSVIRLAAVWQAKPGERLSIRRMVRQKEGERHAAQRGSRGGLRRVWRAEYQQTAATSQPEEKTRTSIAERCRKVAVSQSRHRRASLMRVQRLLFGSGERSSHFSQKGPVELGRVR